ncbi:LOW QUALITY PROTEIN: titin [Drosophila serrata]|uniref:LOW QUALITY PROTEIN: titin n=1 Tax=Drosophila serrata TaxID=7274 RepID=UPI000A1D182C|nr:LOW QUALITY PROTEIN: titin [Drosophila serrata]
MSENKKLLDALLCEIYGRQEQSRQQSSQDSSSSKELKGQLARMVSGMSGNRSTLERLSVRKLIDVCAILKVEILMIGYLLEKVLIARDRLQRHQEVLCEFVTAVLVVESDDAQPKMRFSLSPPPQKAIASSSSSSSTRLTSPTIANATRNISTRSSTTLGPSTTSPGSYNRSPSPRAFGSMLARNGGGHEVNPSATASGSGSAASTTAADDEAASDYNQWLHAMKLVARLPGGTPPEFRRKLWLSLADKYLKSKNVDWAQQREKCFCEEWREDDEELGIQIVKDLHRTGSNLCTGPAGSINQAKLKRILLGYARYNPEVGYCQGFNMLGALILQVMDKEEEESMKVMIYLVEGVLPTGYFYGSMGGLQADMGVFRELMQTRLPRLAKHLQRLQGPVENAFEPPLTNVFTMQWFLTMFCTCLPMSCVLRVWDLVLIEGSDVLLRTALVLWSLLEERVLSVRSADEFYGKMGSYSSELLNGHLVDSNGLIERVVKLGPIADLRQLRDKHLYNIAPLRHKQGLQLYYDDEDTHSDEERMAVATVWGLNWGRRGSVGPAAAGKQPAEQKDRLALDISLLKKQYDRLRERQKQAHVILTTACSTAARQGTGPGNSTQPAVPVNQLLLGRPAIVTNKGKRVGAPLGAIPPARKPSLPAVLHTKPAEKQLRRGETLLWRDTDPSRRRRDSLTWKEIKADRAAMMREGVDVSSMKTQKLRTRFGKSDSSSYSEDSDGEQEVGGGSGGGGSSTDTSLCDDDDPKSMEKSPKQKAKLARKLKEQKQLGSSREASLERQRPKSWAPSSQEIPFILMGTDSGDEKDPPVKEDNDIAEDSATESDRFPYEKDLNFVNFKLEPLDIKSVTEGIELPEIPGLTPISPIPTTKEKSAAEEDLLEEHKPFDGSDSGVTNQYFERVNSVERPNKLELSYSLNEEESETSVAYLEQREKVEGHSADGDYQALPPLPLNPEDDPLPGAGKVPQIRDDNIPGENKDDYKELLSMTIEERVEFKPPPPTASSLSSAARKRRDPRRKTLTRSSTIDIEERYQALERRISQEQPTVERSSKYIPSTAALEERFNTLEKQLSAEKQRKELVEMDADQPEKFERIPSTADLETRFNALTKQMSSSESTAKSPIDLKEDEQASGSSSFKEQKDSEKTSKLHKSEDIESEAQERSSSAKCETNESKEKATEDEKAEQPRLKKLPSTAELEDRFNALERKMSVQKSSPVKTKKEPPDEESNDQESKPQESEKAVLKEHKGNREESEVKVLSPTEEPAPKSKSKPVASPKQAEKSLKESSEGKRDTKESEIVEEDVAPNIEVKKKTDSAKVDPTEKESPKKADPKKVETQKKVESKPVESAKKTESENVTTTKKTDSETKSPAKESKEAPRKSPPSTEELEKRFNALEKQLSTTNLEPTKQAEPTKSPEKTKEVQQDEKAQKSMKSFDDKIKEVNTALVKEQIKVAQKDPAEKKPKSPEEKVKPPLKPEPEQSHQSDLSKRRASEPPSTEDLEKRYETLKRRMSSKNHFSTPNETVNEALERIEQEMISESVEEEKKPPPSTEDLESRFEALQGGEKKPKTQSQPKHVDVAIEAHIPEPPPPPPPPKELPILSGPVLHQQQALIEELQRKMRGQSPGDENLKPSEINPERRQRKLLQRPTPMGDETSEAPANTAYYRAANQEQWQQRMVRRFSDLPSRADLENRLQFLERQLYKKFYKQRCASDSEVASKVKHSPSPDELPTTSRQARAVADGLLEQRVLALEKQLSENSLKLLEAIRDREANAAAPQSDDSGGSPRRLSTETIDATGKELVRYTQNIGELEEVDAHKPINISINIKMLLNKDRSEPKQPKAESQPTTEDLTRRLELLEQQLLEERAKNGSFIPENGVIRPEESEACKKQEKNCHNQHVKSDENQKVEEPVKDQIKPETAKETKTMENEEKAQAQARAKEVVTEKSTKLDKPKVDEKTVVKEVKVEPPIKDKKEEITKKEDKAHVTKEASSEIKPKPTKEENPKKKSPNQKNLPPKESLPKKEIPKTEETSSKESASTNKTQDNPKAETIKAKETASASKESIKQLPEKTKVTTKDLSSPKEVPDKMVINASDLGPMDPNNKTVVLLMDNEPRASRVRRLTRANTEELEGLFQALEKQLSDRNLIKSEDGRLIRADSKPSAEQAEQVQAISDLTKEIEDFTSGKPEEKEKPEEAVKEDKPEPEEPEEDYDWGPNPVKHHLKRKTAYLPSTKELEARFRSLERQIKLLEDVEKIDVEQRLVEIERKIKLQYSLSHEKDLNKYLELCEGRGLDDDETLPEETATKEEETARARDRSRSPGRKVATKSPYTSPSRKVATKSPYTSPSRKSATKSPYTSPSRQREKTPYSSPTRSPERKSKRSPYTSPARRKPHPNDLPISDDLEYKYRVLDLVRSKSKENLAKRMNDPNRKPPIHPLEILLDPSPDDSAIPSTGELEHRIRVLDGKLKSPAKVRSKPRSRSPTIEDMKRQKMRDEQKPRTPVHNLERLVSSPGRPEPPTAEELEERMRILEQEHTFDFKTQKDYRAFNQKLKDVISPSLSFEEFRAAKSREQSPRRHGATTPKSALRRDDYDEATSNTTTTYYRPTSPKVIRFQDEDEDHFEETPRPKSRQTSDRMTLADQPSATRSYASSSEGLDALGSRLMRETSPITRTGTHTGVPLRTGENINDRLSSIKNSIKSIDNLCEEKPPPYQKEKCQRYIDSLFSDSLHFASKKSSLEDLSLSRSLSRSESRGRSIHRASGDYAPSIRITSEHRSLGSAESRRSPLGSSARDTSPLHYRSHRDMSRDLSPRRRRLEEQEEEEERERRERERERERESSRVRRDNLLPNYSADNRSELSSGSSLTGFNHKVDRQLEETCAKYADDARRSACRTPLSHPYESRSTATRHQQPSHHTDPVQDSFPRPVSPYRQAYEPRGPAGATSSSAPVYQPGKLEIRHTTVTSTFYDRFLTEKQIERTHSRPNSRSPVASPSVPARGSYGDFSTTTSAPSCTTATVTPSLMSSSYAGTSFSLPTSSQYPYSRVTSSSDLRSAATATTTSASSTSTTTSSYVPYNFSSSFTSRLSDPITTCSASTSSLTTSTGVYNPMMSFTLREPLASSSLGAASASPLAPFQFNRTFVSNFDKEQEKK